ncbi:hypothetical protein [Bartonella sp. AU15XJBT]|uniref:hypothetical protein n=1 Tax=Bartonella sp. AU15XJBT TaxID=3019087 RepID=UPI00235DEAB5|nr:hypothetical protein [Bartonella sp. AU15XJBT]
MGQDVGESEETGARVRSTFILRVRGAIKGPLYDGQVAGQVFFYWREKGVCAPVHWGKMLGDSRFVGGVFLPI